MQYSTRTRRPSGVVDTLATATRLRPVALDSARRPAAVEAFPHNPEQALELLALDLVGKLSLKDAQRILRQTMSRVALQRCSGSQRAAAVLLGIDRRYVRKLLDACALWSERGASEPLAE